MGYDVLVVSISIVQWRLHLLTCVLADSEETRKRFSALPRRIGKFTEGRLIGDAPLQPAAKSAATDVQRRRWAHRRRIARYPKSRQKRQDCVVSEQIARSP